MSPFLPRSFSNAVFSALIFATATLSSVSQGAQALDCSAEGSLRSAQPGSPVELSFRNASTERRRIYWLDPTGDRKFVGLVEGGNQFKQPTSSGHSWIVTDDAEKCLTAVTATADPMTIDIGGVATAQLMPPVPGAQQPLAPAAPAAPPPPAVVQAPPPAAIVQASPPPAAVAAAPPEPAPQDAMAQLPQVSPVEQFQLRGAYRLVTRLDNSKALNTEASGTVDVIAVSPEWDSGQWTFESVPNTPFVRIKNAWKKTYLADVNGKPRAIPASPEATEGHWSFEPVDGTNFVQFRNRETDRFLLSVNGAAALVDDFRQDQDNYSQWRPVAAAPGGRPVAAAPAAPRNSAYDLALADCREIGGYWTGSTCRRPAYFTEPLSCRRGFQWSEATGECEWIGGGNCPPWQMGPGGTCRRDLVCRGGEVGISGNGYQACYCPRGTVVWGDYPTFSCVASISRVAPYLVPAVVGGVVLGIIGGGKDRPQVGNVFGNKRFCGSGQTGTPPNCVAAATCQPPLVGTPPNCYRQMPRPTPTPVATPVVAPTTTPVVTPTTTPVVTPTTTPGIIERPSPTSTPTGAAPVCANNAFLNSGCRCELPMRPTADGRCFAMPSAGQACLDGQNMSGGCVCLLQKFEVAGAGSVCATSAPRAGTVCQIGQTKDASGNCVSLNASITCTGGRIEQGVCGCPAGTTLQGGGTNFQCVAAGGNNKICQIGETKDAAGNCVKLNASITCTGGRIEQGVCGCPSGTRLTGSGQNFQCVAANTTPTPTPTPATGGGATGGGQPTPQTGGGPPRCTDGQNTASGCLCAAPLTVLPGGKCTQPTARGAACLEGQNIAQTGCNCAVPLKPIENGVCGRLLLNETKPISKGGICKQGDDIAATGCTCNMNTVDAGGGKFICSSVNYTTCTDGQLMGGSGCKCRMTTVKVGNDLYCTSSGKAPIVGGASCSEGQSTAGGCRCVLPLVDLPGGRCGKPTRGGACLEGQNIAQTGCNCEAPLKPIERGVCGRLLSDESRPTTKGGNCADGQDIIATKCACLMKTVDQGGGKFICSANPPPSGVKTAPSPRPGTTIAPSPTPSPAPTTTPPPAPKPGVPPSPTPSVVPTPTVAPKPVATPSPTPTAAPKPVVAPSPAPAPKPEVAPQPKPVTPPPPPPPKPVTTPPPPKPVIAPPPPPKPVTPPPPPPPKPVTAPPPPPKPVAPPPPPPPKPVTAPPPPAPPACAPPKKLNPQGQCV